MTDDLDTAWLREASKLAELYPPSDTAFSVGAIIVAADGNEISRGYSRETHPTIHAEESALEKAAGDSRLQGGTIYTTLEPCGERRSRPLTCAQLIISAGIARVVLAWREPNKFVSVPSGISVLTDAGLDVVEMPDVGPPLMV